MAGHAHDVKHRVALALVFSLFAAACGSSGGDEATSTSTTPSSTVSVASSDTTTSSVPAAEPAGEAEPESQTAESVAETAPPVTEPAPTELISVASEDGELTVTLPSDVAQELGVTVRRLDSSELPPEVAGGDNLDSVKVYELAPDGATFDEPVTVTRRFDVGAFDFLELGPNDVPFITLLNRDSDEKYEVLDDLTMTRIGDDLFVSGTTTHFSGFVAGNEGTAIRDMSTNATADGALERLEALDSLRRILGGWLDQAVNSDDPGYDVSNFLLQYARYARTQPGLDDAGAVGVAASLLFDGAEAGVEPDAVATEVVPADGNDGVVAIQQESTFVVPIENAPTAWALTDGNADQPSTIDYTVRSFAVGVPPELFPEPFLADLKLTLGVTTFHSAFETYASFLKLLIGGLGDFPPGGRLFMGLTDAGSFDGGTRIIDLRSLDVLDDAATTLDLGIECFCEYEFVLFYLDLADELAEEALAEAATLDEALAILGAQENIARLVSEAFPDDPFGAQVTADEGPIGTEVALVTELLGQ